jgi:hypothetical protein
LYAIQVAGGGPVKLGKAGDPISRLQNLQCASAVPLTLLMAVPEWVFSEREAHELWSHLRRKGEWFEPDPALLDWVHRELPLLHERRGRIAERFQAVVRRREARLHGTNALARMAERIRRIEAERLRHEKRLQREREHLEVQERKAALRLQSCALCTETMTAGAVTFEGWLHTCQPCARWVRACDTKTSATVEKEYRRAIDRAEEALSKALLRLDKHLRNSEQMQSLLRSHKE